MKLDLAAATTAIREQIAEPLGMSVEQAAAGIRRVVDGHMADTLREVTIGRGHDPRDFVLLAYGGAGPAHCVGYGAELGVPRILIPATSMAHSAYGALASDIQQSRRALAGAARRRRRPRSLGRSRLRCHQCRVSPNCRSAASRRWSSRDFTQAQSELARSIDMRYRRQTHDLMVPGSRRSGDAGDGAQAASKSFEESYEAVYGKGAGFRFAGIELTTFRVVAVGRTQKPSIRKPSAVAAPKPGTPPHL